MRVGAVACHEDKTAAELPLDEQFKTSLSHLYDQVTPDLLKARWMRQLDGVALAQVSDDETVDSVATRLGVDPFDIVFLNKRAPPTHLPTITTLRRNPSLDPEPTHYSPHTGRPAWAGAECVLGIGLIF